MALNPRQIAILQSVREQGSVKTEELAEEFGITLQTARRDIQRLTEAAELERFHGGVRAVDSSTRNTTYTERQRTQSEAKQDIARQVAAAIPHGASLFMNIGTTVEAVANELLGEGAPEAPTTTPWDQSGPLVSGYSLRARAGRPVRLRQMTAMGPSVMHDRPDEEAARRVARGKSTGFDELSRRNRALWADLWKGRIVVRGASTEHQALIDAAFFYLNSSSHPASPAATSIFGLATWHDYSYYFGHVMWDIDAFCLPPLVLSQPEADVHEGEDFDRLGRIDGVLLRDLLEVEDYDQIDFAVCGPGAFTQSVYDSLRELDIRDGEVISDDSTPSIGSELDLCVPSSHVRLSQKSNI